METTQLQLMAVDLYSRVLSDDQLSPYFKDADIAQVITHQMTMFKAIIAGSAPPLTREELLIKHFPKKITNAHFDRFLQHLKDSLIFVKVIEITRILEAFESYRSVIVNEDNRGL
jgi:truncated hemoglobin YjbI